MLSVNRIVAPTDFSEPSKKGVEAAVKIAGHFGAELLLVHVLPSISTLAGATTVANYHLPSVEQEMRIEMQTLAEKLIKEMVPETVRTSIRMAQGRPADQIAEMAREENADLIVIASHGESGWKRMLTGSVAERVIRHAQCPVLTITQA